MKTELVEKLLMMLLNESNSNDDEMFEVGKSYLIRTVTNYHTGRLVSNNDKFLKLEDAAWIADCGRFNEALRSGEFQEVEPFENSILVAKGAIIDCTEFNHELPRLVK